MGYDRPTTTIPVEAAVPSKIDSSRPFKPLRIYVLYPALYILFGWMLGTGTFDNVVTGYTFSTPATPVTAVVCTTTTTAPTTPQR
jgi:hypothetical protein